jgi:hypothetical protein
MLIKICSELRSYARRLPCRGDWQGASNNARLHEREVGPTTAR